MLFARELVLHDRAWRQQRRNFIPDFLWPLRGPLAFVSAPFVNWKKGEGLTMGPAPRAALGLILLGILALPNDSSGGKKEM